MDEVYRFCFYISVSGYIDFYRRDVIMLIKSICSELLFLRVFFWVGWDFEDEEEVEVYLLNYINVFFVCCEVIGF